MATTAIPSSTSDDQQPASVREQVYQEQLRALEQELTDLEEGNHAEFENFKQTNEANYSERLDYNQVVYDVELARIVGDYEASRSVIARESSEKRSELLDTLLQELDDKRKQIDHEYHNLELTGGNDIVDNKSFPTRKLRRRPNEPIPQAEKRVKAGGKETPSLVFRMADADIDEDLKEIGIVPTHRTTGGSCTPVYASCNSPMPDIQQCRCVIGAGDANASIERGQLFYDSKCYLRGQSIYIETSDLGKVAAVIQQINSIEMLCKSVGENKRFVVTLAEMQQGKALLKKRTS